VVVNLHLFHIASLASYSLFSPPEESWHPVSILFAPEIPVSQLSLLLPLPLFGSCPIYFLIDRNSSQQRISLYSPLSFFFFFISLLKAFMFVSYPPFSSPFSYVDEGMKHTFFSAGLLLTRLRSGGKLSCWTPPSPSPPPINIDQR